MTIRLAMLACGLVLAGPWARADIEIGIRHFQALDYEAATTALRPLAGQDGLACWYLGLMHDPVYHRPAPGRFYQTDWLDRDTAASYYEQAIELDEPYAFHSLVFLYSDPEIKQRLVNPAWLAETLRRRAMEPLAKRVAAGDGVAAYMLSDLSRVEVDDEQHADTAHRLLLEEALEGRPASQLYLAHAYDTHLLGEHQGPYGHVTDNIHAFAWYTIATLHGEEHARRHQAVSAMKLRKRDFDKAEQLTRQLLGQITANKRR